MGLVVAHEAVDQRLAGPGLHLRVEGRAHREAALVELLLAVALGDLAADLLGEVVGVGGVREGDARVDAERHLLGGLRLLPGDVAVLRHQADDLVAAVEGRLGLAVGVVVVRPLRQGGEVGRLVDGQLVDRLAEIVERRGRDAVQVAAGHDRAEEDLVEVELEDLVLRVGRLDPERQQRLLDLAVVGLLGGEQEVLGDLLGDGRGALPLARLGVGQEGAHDPLGVDAAVLVEVLVLGRQEGRDDDLRHRLDRQVQPALAGVLGQQRAVRRVDAGHHRRLVIGERGVVGQVLAVLPVEVTAHRRADHEQHRGGAEQDPKETEDQTHPVFRSSLARPNAGIGSSGACTPRAARPAPGRSRETPSECRFRRPCDGASDVPYRHSIYGETGAAAAARRVGAGRPSVARLVKNWSIALAMEPVTSARHSGDCSISRSRLLER